MGNEIERKFLVKDLSFKQLATGTPYRQGYLSSAGECTVRVRVAEGQGFLTIKGQAVGLTRPEYEYAIPVAEAEAMLEGLAQKPLIEKTRYRIPHGQHLWEVDEFFGENAGLILAEIELQKEDESFALPAWVGKEVTDDPRYLNANLVKQPYRKW